LQFPHHDNELAQSEAYYKSKQWINHFWHAGHLNIKGLKMSKSLKNFTTIRDILNSGITARTIRFMFLMSPWHGVMNFADDSLEAAKSKEKSFQEFFADTAHTIRNKPIADTNQYWTQPDREMHKLLHTTQQKVHERLCDNFDYPAVILLLSDLISATQKYRQIADSKTVILQQIRQYVDKMLRTFGVMNDIDAGFIQLGSDENQERLQGILNALTTFRQDVRSAAMKLKDSNGSKDILSLCDKLRNETLIDVGVRIEDSESGSIWKLADPNELRQQRDQEAAEKNEKLLSKLRTRLEADKKTLDKAIQSSISPIDFFKQKNEYSQYDADGKPTHDTAGNELSKSAIKKAAKEYATQHTAHQKYLQEMQKNPRYIDDLKQSVATTEQDIQSLLKK